MPVVVEEIGTGVIGGSGGDNFDIGQFLLPSGKVVVPSDDVVYTSPVISPTPVAQLTDDLVAAAYERPMSTYEAPKSEVMNEVVKVMAENSGSSPSINDLKVVTDILAGGSCADVEQIMAQTGLDKTTVVYCIEWLVSQGLVAQDATRYCGLSSVKRMCQQLKGCKECFSERL